MTPPVPVEPTLDAIRATRARLGDRVLTTPVRLWQDGALARLVGVFVHPFEGPKTALGTATLGLELVEQAEGLDAVIVPIGGGGLCAGVASAVKLASPRTLVFGVEPEGADSMHRSFAAGSPQAIDAVRTIADSLGAPHAAPYSFGLCRRGTWTTWCG